MSRPGMRIFLAALLANLVLLGGCENFLGFGAKTSDADRHPEQAETANSANPHDSVGKAGMAKSHATPSQATVTRVQTHLKQLGFEPGPVDGRMGPRTKSAVKEFQTAHHLPATGTITELFLQQLEEAAAGGGLKVRQSGGSHTKFFPPYRPGTAFVYSNGDIERVAKIEGDTTQWIRNDGITYTAHKNFLMPWLYWTSDRERGTAKIPDQVASLWPELNGPETRFSLEMTAQRKGNPNSTRRWVEHWRCRNSGTRMIEIRAGRFRTLIFDCIRRAGANSPELARTWYYAPNIRHYVRFIERDPVQNRTETFDLLAIQPSMAAWPPIIRSGLSRSLSQALEKAETGARVVWSSSGVNTRVTIEPKSRLTSGDGRPCRRFVQTWIEGGRRWVYPAVACKNSPGKWEIPGIANKAFNPSAESSKAY